MNGVCLWHLVAGRGYLVLLGWEGGYSCWSGKKTGVLMVLWCAGWDVHGSSIDSGCLRKTRDETCLTLPCLSVSQVSEGISTRL